MVQDNSEVLLTLVRDMDKKIDVLGVRVSSLENQVGELNTTIRGSNGYVGLVAEVAVIQTKLDAVLELNETSKEPAVPVQPAPVKSEPSDKVTWTTMAERFFLPIAVSALLWFLLTVLPSWIGHVGAP